MKIEVVLSVIFIVLYAVALVVALATKEEEIIITSDSIIKK
jgi:hypothetical protein